MNVVIIDAQGGGIGRMLVEEIKKRLPAQPLTVVGTNALATSAMLRAGGDHGATGENAVCVCARSADLILGPIGIVLADSMLGEVTGRMASAVASSSAHKILIPISRCQVTVAGMPQLSVSQAVDAAVREVCTRISGASDSCKE